MLRSSVCRLGSLVTQAFRTHTVNALGATSARQMSSKKPEDGAVDYYVNFFNRPDIDGWLIRKGMNDLQGMDLVPDPDVINAALRACRKVNDHSLAIRFLESVKFKCADNVNTFWPYLMQECGPTMKELGISTLEELGYDKPELALANVYDIHG